METIPWSIFLLLLTAGLAGSLHCIGMCGPIVVGFSRAFGSAELTVGGAAIASRRRSVALDFAGYHLGRLWTYAMLGLAAGLVGHGVRATGAWYGFQRGVSLALSAAIIAGGIVMLGVLPWGKLDLSLGGCGWKRFAQARWFRALASGRGLSARILLGAVMGLLPCGLVYASLIVAAAMTRPWMAAAGMAAFGLGTIPSLTAVIVAARLVPARWAGALAPHAQKLAAAVLIVTGSWMLYRAWVGGPEAVCPMCEARAVDSNTLPPAAGQSMLMPHEPD